MLREIFRTGALTTGVLVTVIAFGAAIKPLSDDALFSAGQIALYITLAMVPMLQFALPFAAGFAGTMSLHRMAGDNEVIAASAGGISHRRLLVPVAALGLALMLVMIGLTQFVIPRFWGLLERTVARDITVLFQRTISSGEPFVLGDLQVWADRIVLDPDAPEDVDARLRLFQVAVAALDAEGRVSTDVTANQIAIDIRRLPGETLLSLATADAVATRPDDGMLAWMERPEPATIRIPTGNRESPKRMTLPELIGLLSSADDHPRVATVHRDLAEAVRFEDAVRTIGDRLAGDGNVEMTGQAAGRLEITGAQWDGRRLVPSGATDIVVTQAIGDRTTRTFRCQEIVLTRHVGGGLGTLANGLTVGTRDASDELKLRIEMNDVAWSDADAAETVNRRATVPIEGLKLDGFDDTAALAASPADLASKIEAGAYGRRVERLLERVQDATAVLQREVRARMMSRFANSATAPLLLLLGAVLAMWRRQSTPLAIYLLAFLPSVLDLILISSGEQLVRDGNEVGGMILMWAGNAVLVGLIGFAYNRLARN